MKSYVVNKKEEFIKFPCLMEAKSIPGRIVRFTDLNTGMLIHCSTASSDLFLENKWDINDFKPFNGKVVFEN